MPRVWTIGRDRFNAQRHDRSDVAVDRAATLSQRRRDHDLDVGRQRSRGSLLPGFDVQQAVSSSGVPLVCAAGSQICTGEFVFAA